VPLCFKKPLGFKQQIMSFKKKAIDLLVIEDDFARAAGAKNVMVVAKLLRKTRLAF